MAKKKKRTKKNKNSKNRQVPIKKEKKGFKHYLELLPELRKVVIAEMNPDDRCRFLRCSRLCAEEVMNSEVYVYGLRFDGCSANRVRIYVQFGKHWSLGYQYTFETNTESGKKYLRYSRSKTEQLWSDDLNDGTDMMDWATEYFHSLLYRHQKTIKELFMCNVGYIRFEVRSFNNLRKLEMSSYVDNIMDTIIRRPIYLEEFACLGEIDQFLLEDDGEYVPFWENPIPRPDSRRYSLLCQVQNRLKCPQVKLNYDQFIRLSATETNIHIGDLTPFQIHSFITFWKIGQVRENFKSCCWNTNGRFDERRLWRLFEQQHHGDVEREQFKIKQNVENGKSAMLSYYVPRRELLFEVIDE